MNHLFNDLSVIGWKSQEYHLQFLSSVKTTLDMSCQDEEDSVFDSGQDQEESLSGAPDSLPTFQMFREKKLKVESELRYHYRVVLGTENPCLPWFGSVKSSVDDWSLATESGEEESLPDIFSKYSDKRLTLLLEGGTSKGKTSLLRQVCLDWGRGASYLQHFHLVILLDCHQLELRDGADLDKYLAKSYKIIKQQKINLHKWEVRK